MRDDQRRRRDRSFLGILVVIVTTVAFQYVRRHLVTESATERGGVASDVVLYAGWFTILCLWFKGFFHWCKAKGYPWGFTLIGILNFPVGPIVMALLKDRCGSPPPLGDPLRKCPACGQGYRLGEYDADASRIFCSGCKKELMRE